MDLEVQGEAVVGEAVAEEEVVAAVDSELLARAVAQLLAGEDWAVVAAVAGAAVAAGPEEAKLVAAARMAAAEVAAAGQAGREVALRSYRLAPSISPAER